MDNDPRFPEPKRILQRYDPEQQRQFEHFTPQDRLNWLATINELYWAGIRYFRDHPH